MRKIKPFRTRALIHCYLVIGLVRFMTIVGLMLEEFISSQVPEAMYKYGFLSGMRGDGKPTYFF